MKMKTTMILTLVLIEALILSAACEEKAALSPVGAIVMERKKCVEACVDDWARTQAEAGPDALGKQIRACETRFPANCTVAPMEFSK